MLQPNKTAAAEPEAVVVEQPSVKFRIAMTIRRRWIERHKQDWGQQLCGDLAQEVLGELTAPPKAALEAAKITDEQWADFIAAAQAHK